MSSSTQLRGVSNFGDSLLTDQLTSNVIEFLSWGFLGIGAFFNVAAATSGSYGGRENKLRLSEDPNYNKGQVWEGFRSNWVWESGIEYNNQPIPISGIYLNNVFVPTATTGTSSYSINYPLGRITFDNAISARSDVQLNYTFKQVNVYSADSSWFKELQFNSYRIDDSHFNLYGSGVWSIDAQNRVQLPAVIVEAVPNRSFVGKELGGGSFVYQDILFHIITETSFERGNLVDILTFQKQHRINLFDKNLVQNANAWPLDNYGSIAPSALCYPDLVKKYFAGSNAYFFNTTSQEMTSLIPGLFMGIVRATFEIDSPQL